MNEEQLKGKHLIFYDGICSLCNRSIIFVFNHDKNDQFIVVQLQSKQANILLKNYMEFDSKKLNSVALIKYFGTEKEEFYTKSTASLSILEACSGYKTLAKILLKFPKVLRDFVYDIIALSRYQVFGKFDKCPVPDPKFRKKVIN